MYHKRGMTMLSLVVLMAAYPPRQASRVPHPPLKGPVVVVALKDGCPCAQECHLALNTFAKACKGKVRFIGLIDADERRAKSTAREAGLEFSVIPDPRGTLLRSMNAKKALDLRLLNRRGELVACRNGLSRGNVASLVDAIRSFTGVDVSLDLTPFNQLPKIGCSFAP